MTQPMLKLIGVIAGLVAAALCIAALAPVLAALILAVLCLVPGVIIIMIAWPVIWLTRTCFGLPWDWAYVCQKFRELRDKTSKEADTIQTPLPGKETAV